MERNNKCKCGKPAEVASIYKTGLVDPGTAELCLNCSLIEHELELT